MGQATTALGDRITSGTLAMIANSATSVVSLSAAGTTWGYLSSLMSYLPRINAERVSSSLISSTYVQLSSSTTLLACNSTLTGTVRYSSGTIQFCHDNMWKGLGGAGEYLHVMGSSNQNDITSGQTIALNSVVSANSNAVSFNPGTHRFILRAGNSYKLTGRVRLNGTTTPSESWIAVMWRNITGNVAIGAYGVVYAQSTTGAWSDLEQAIAYITPIVDTEVALVQANGTVGVDLANMEAFIEVMTTGSGGVGGGGASALSDLTDVSVAGAAPGSILSYNGSAWVVSSSVSASSALGDRITSGTLAMIANSNTSVVSLSTGGTTWGYFSSLMSYLPRINAERVSSTLVSTTYVQFSSATIVLSCGSPLVGTMRYTSGTVQVCDGINWSNVGIGVPTGAIMAFHETACPDGWTEYTPARGRFLRGIDNGAGNDPGGTRAPGNVQADMVGPHNHQLAVSMGTSGDYGLRDAGNATSTGAPWTQNNSGVETRPKNVAVIFCQYSGIGGGGGGGDGSPTTLDDLTDVNTSGAAVGSILAYDGANWVISSTVSVSSALGDRIVSGTASVVAHENRGVSTSVPVDVSGSVRVSGTLQLAQGAGDEACGSGHYGTIRIGPDGDLEVCLYEGP